ncbi:acetylcholine receptor subunit alpha-like 1 [Watersipora subatra]|uniref:acetylcholine receptor subunit alpha-like 1 n=1 Tax=Watersipora subatra TaxID=2589382 RepID=UPI00355C7E49
MHAFLLIQGFWIVVTVQAYEDATSHAKRLYNDLLVNSRYNKLIRPVANNSDTLTVKLGLRLTQLIGIDEKNQIMTTNVWLNQEWDDFNLAWDPNKYGEIDHLYVPAEHLWKPGIVLFNNADGNYEATLVTKATVYHTGRVVWEPPVIYKSTCTIDVEFFPFDEQTCDMKFGSWTYDGKQVDLQHKDNPNMTGEYNISMAMDLSGYYQSFIWDVLSVPATRHKVYLDCCPHPYFDVTFQLTIRRKTLFYTVNLIIPSVAISFLTVFVFYLPSDSGEKITLCISILLSLTVFFLLLADLIPPTSLVVPLIGKYLLFTMILVTLSVVITVVVLNIDGRTKATHSMPPWLKNLGLHILPKLLFMERPKPLAMGVKDKIAKEVKLAMQRSNGTHPNSPNGRQQASGEPAASTKKPRKLRYPPEIERALEDINFIADQLREEDEEEQVQENWKFIALVIDRFFLWLFTSACVVGTFGIILQAPSLYATSKPMDVGI